MNIEDIIRAWKTDGEALEPLLPTSPVGQELSEEDLLEVNGGDIVPGCQFTCRATHCYQGSIYFD